MPESFHNVRLPVCVELGAVGGPGFLTSIIATSSGDEYRNVEWSRSRGSWLVGYSNNHKINEEIIAFFMARRGRAYGFRFRDWADYKVNNVFAIGDGSTTEFQAAKVYRSGDEQFLRPLTRLVGPVSIRVGEDVVAAEADVNTGKVKITGATPADGAEIWITCEFDVPVRFDLDELPTSMLTKDLSTIEDIPIVEIRDRGPIPIDDEPEGEP